MHTNVFEEYFTTARHKARIYCRDAGGAYPIHGAVVIDFTGVWMPVQWTEKGECSLKDRADLNIPFLARKKGA